MPRTGAMPTGEEKIEEFAEDLGRILGKAQAKAKGWLGQRQRIVATLETIRRTSEELLRELGRQSARLSEIGRGPDLATGRTDGKRRSKGVRRNKRSKISAAGRARISAAQKARWAKYKAIHRKKS